MNSLREASYRMSLAEGYLRRAERFFKENAWLDCVRDAQAAVENAAKAIIANFAPVQRSHEPARQLEALLENGAFPEHLRPLVESGLAVFGAMGHREHIAVTYGDEETFTLPWELFDREDAKKALEVARKAVEIAREVMAQL